MKNILVKKISILCCLPILLSACKKESYIVNDIQQYESNSTTKSTLLEPEPELIDSEYKYNILPDDTIEIIGYIGEIEILDIPSTLNGYTVTRIGDFAFENPNGNISILKSVTIPESVMEIGEGAFIDCSSLSNIIISNNTALIGYAAFKGTPFLDNQTEDYIIINEHLIKYNGKEENVIIPEEVKYINEAFTLNNNIKSIIIPDDVIKIGKHAFAMCENLTSVTLPDKNIIIGSETFVGCTSLSSINLSEKINELGYNVFLFTKFLYNKMSINKYVVINNILIYIDRAFISKDEVIPDSLGIVKIGSGAFYEIDKLYSVIIPDGVTKIDEKAFFNCIYLKSISIPDSVIEIEKDAFLDCINLTISCSEGSYAQQYCIENSIEFEII